MATYTYHMLINGNAEIIDMYNRAINKWNEILDGFDWANDESPLKLAELLTINQIGFEHEITTGFEEIEGDHRLKGQEIMVVTGIGQFYNPVRGWESDLDKAISMYRAFLMSRCSVEVKSLAEEIGALYYLDVDSSGSGSAL